MGQRSMLVRKVDVGNKGTGKEDARKKRHWEQSTLGTNRVLGKRDQENGHQENTTVTLDTSTPQANFSLNIINIKN